MLSTYINKLDQNKTLNQSESRDCLNTLFQEDCTEEEILKLLTLLRDYGETVDEVVGFAQAIQKESIPLTLNKPCIDVCGTGGSGKDRFNVSTAAVFILGALGIPVSKHGNRGSKTSNGSFDFLEALDIPFNHDAEVITEIFKETGICFIFARQFHPSLAKVGPARQALGTRSIFNYLGPLCNPANPGYQIIGTSTLEIAKKLAKAKQILGTQKTLVIVGANGLDELSTSGKSDILEVSSTSIIQHKVDPKELGLVYHNENEISGKTATENANVFKDLFKKGNSQAPISQVICLNAGAALWCMGHTESIENGFKLAQSALKSGKAWETFIKYQSIAQKKRAH
ncbi:anthranilate phosphoribosyltransferase [Candidatus Marinamargulisbacteria bacterium SCGC AG-439-L15]|nr:anthranilate phosphoribosyltransferase [Candidatus Marinamargulisbacteria bacterium SCGC AG-439-L15]